MRKKQPVSIWGIEFDALIDEQKTMSSKIPVYPIENGFPVSDTITNEPLSLSLNLYISNTPVTWLFRHGTSKDRVNMICNLIEKKWLEKNLTKIVTSDTIYTDMGITSIVIKKSSDIGYAREVSVTAQKVYITKKRTTVIPNYSLKSGKSKASAGKASKSSSSKKGSSSGTSPGHKGSKSGGKSGSNSNKKDAKKKHSILYGVAKGSKLF